MPVLQEMFEIFGLLMLTMTKNNYGMNNVIKRSHVFRKHFRTLEKATWNWKAPRFNGLFLFPGLLRASLMSYNSQAYF
jgi:hypothetical protein